MFLPTMFLLILITTRLVFIETAIVDSFNQCGVKDNECLRKFYQSLINILVNKGMSELGIKKIDPMEIEPTNVFLPGIFNVTLIEGSVEGIKNCLIKSFINDMENGKAIIQTLCDRLIIQGQYKVDLTGSVLKATNIGDDFRGEGHGKITMDKAEIHIEFPFHFEKRNGDIYFKLEKNGTKYDFNVLENVSFDAEDLVVGKRETSKEIIKYVNENWKAMFQTFGKVFFGKAIDHVHVLSSKFFDNVSVKHFINEDLSSYIK